MKAYPFEEKRLAKWQPPYIVQPKYDGFRCRAIKLDNDKWILLSSEENLIFSVPHINKSLTDKKVPDIELDGELYVHGMSFDGISSIASRTINLHPDYEKMQFHIFDLVNEDSQIKRMIDLINIGMDLPLVKSPYWICRSLEEIMDTYDRLISYGYEGIIVRHYMNVYERKRSTNVMKFKPKKEDNYVICGYEEEISIHGDRKNSLGSLTLQSGDGKTFSVGTGFTKADRETMWRNKESLLGKTCKVQYQHITPGNKVPRFPVFCEIVK
jgi:DNA ligase-1